MSGLIVGLVLRTPITDTFTTEAKFIATVYADHAWEDGTHAHPAVETVARITGLSVRTVQRYLHGALLQIGMLIPDGKGPRGTIQYRFPLESREDGSIRLKLLGGVTVTPRQPDGGDTESGDTESGDTMVSPKQTNRPLIHEEEEKPAPKKFEFAQELQNELKDLGVFVSTWKHVETQMAAGWTELDILALIDWQSETRKDKAKAAQGFVTRIREGSKAPQEYYQFNRRRQLGKWLPIVCGCDDVQSADFQDELASEEPIVVGARGFEPQVANAWDTVLGQLALEMNRGTYSKYLSGTMLTAWDGEQLTIAVPGAESRDWLDSRIKSTAERLLVGVMNQEVKIKFVAAETAEVES